MSTSNSPEKTLAEELEELRLLTRQMSESCSKAGEREDSYLTKMVSRSFNYFVKNIQGPRTVSLTYEDVCCMCSILLLPYLHQSDEFDKPYDSDDEENDDTALEYSDSRGVQLLEKAAELFESMDKNVTPVEQAQAIARKCKAFVVEHCRDIIVVAQAGIVTARLLQCNPIIEE